MDKENASSVELPESGDIEIIGIRFRDAGKVYYFYPSGIKFEAGDFAVVETARGIEYGYVSEGNRRIKDSSSAPSRCQKSNGSRHREIRGKQAS